MLEKIATANAPKAIGPYSQAIKVGNMLYTSGQIPLDPVSGDIVGNNITEQTEQVMKNLSAVLAAAGTSFDNAVKTTCFIADMADFADFNAGTHNRRSTPDHGCHPSRRESVLSPSGIPVQAVQQIHEQ